MKEKDVPCDKKYFSEQLKRLQPNRIIIAHGTHPIPVEGALFAPFPRILTVLNGRRPFNYCCGDDIKNDVLLPGVILYTRSHTWWQPDFTVPCLFTGIRLGPVFIRLHSHKSPCRKTVLPDYWYHTQEPLVMPGRKLIEVLELLGTGSRGIGSPHGNILKALLQVISAQLDGEQQKNNSKTSLLYQQIVEYLSENFQEEINREYIARLFKIHPNYLSSMFSREGGTTFNLVLNKFRIQYAKQLLLNPVLRINEVAYRCGYNSSGYFIRKFHELCECSPGVYRDRLAV